MKLLALIFGRVVWRFHSRLIRFILVSKGIKVGRGFYIEGFPILKIEGLSKDIVIGDDVSIMGDIDIRNRENGRIQIGNGCRIDHRVRLVAAKSATLKIGNGSNIGCYSVLNCGADVTIGEKCLISGFVYIQSSNHGTAIGTPIKDQIHLYAPVVIGDDVWLGSHVSVLAGAKIGSGAVIGSKAVVMGEIEQNAVAVGVPAKTCRFRE